jgi:hypothetical protein
MVRNGARRFVAKRQCGREKVKAMRTQQQREYGCNSNAKETLTQKECERLRPRKQRDAMRKQCDEKAIRSRKQSECKSDANAKAMRAEERFESNAYTRKHTANPSENNAMRKLRKRKSEEERKRFHIALHKCSYQSLPCSAPRY